MPVTRTMNSTATTATTTPRAGICTPKKVSGRSAGGRYSSIPYTRLTITSMINAVMPSGTHTSRPAMK